MSGSKYNAKIKASAMGYAVVFLLLAGMTCSAFVFISSGYKRMEVGFLKKEHVIFNNYFSLKLGAHSEPGSRMIIHESGDTSKISVKNWGAYKAITATTYNANIRKEKSAISADASSNKLPVLFVTDRKKPIKVSGTTIIEGNVSVSSERFETGYVGGNSIKKYHKFEGSFIESSKSMPRLKVDPKSMIPEWTIDYLPQEDYDTSFSFHETTRKWFSESYISIKGSLNGNVIIESSDSIIVEETARLENVILHAPLIRIREGFKGTLQAISNGSIICETNTTLNYPSSLMIISKDQVESHNEIHINKGSCVMGAILLWNEKYNFREPPLLYMDENVLFSGFIYNQGESEIHGTVIGSLFTNDLTLNAGGGVYKGHLFNTKLTNRDLPKDFVYPNWIEDKTKCTSKLMLCF